MRGCTRELAEARRELVRRQAAGLRESAAARLARPRPRRPRTRSTVARIVGSSFDSPRRLATLVGRQRGGRRDRPAGALARRPDRPGARDRALGLARPARHRRRQQRAGAAAARRHAGDRGRPRRRHDRAAHARGRPESVPPRRRPRHLGDRRPLPARRAGGAGDPASRATPRSRGRSPIRRGSTSRSSSASTSRRPRARSMRRRRRARPRRRSPGRPGRGRASRTIRATSPASSSSRPQSCRSGRREPAR